MGNWDVSKPNKDGERELIDRAVKALEAELATKTCNKQIVSKLEDAELARDSEITCNNKQVTSKLVASEDAISRQAAIDAFSMFAEYESNRTNAEWVNRIRVVLSSLPPVQPIRPRGHWIFEEGDGETCVDGLCSICKSESCVSNGTAISKTDYEARLKADTVVILDKIRAEIIAKDKNVKAIRSDDCCFFTADEILNILNKYKEESEG